MMMTFDEYRIKYPHLTRPVAQNLLRAPAWQPTCPQCGASAEWTAAQDLIVRCTVCPHWALGVYPEDGGHEHMEKRWRRTGGDNAQKRLER